MKKEKQIFVHLCFLVAICSLLTPVSGFGGALEGTLKMDRILGEPHDIVIHPVQHASFVIVSGQKIVYVDPVGSGELYSNFPKPNLILITHTHGDHLDQDTILKIKGERTVIVGPVDVEKQLPGIQVMRNGETAIKAGLKIEAVAMYNMTKGRLKFHPKGRGNGYVVTIHTKRIYISGDTEDVPEMKTLTRIDAAFVCLNLPFTMDEVQAASAVLAFKPKVVYPYHYRGKKEGQPFFHDVDKFTRLVSGNKGITVRHLKWY